MTQPTYVVAVAGETVVIQVEVTPGGGTYASPMSINMARNLELSATAEATVLPCTSNPSLPGQTVRSVTSTDWKATGAGITNLGDDMTYATWLLSGQPKNVQISNMNTGGLILTGPAVLTACTPMNSGGVGKKADFSVTLEQAGVCVITSHA